VSALSTLNCHSVAQMLAEDSERAARLRGAIGRRTAAPARSLS
jgi:hypothetical protein